MKKYFRNILEKIKGLFKKKKKKKRGRPPKLRGF
tara:strand:- start:210 stop:311 length:102 start_codon:yes stop_codon:yes gene_type:complete